ncbi:MAG: ATP/GTP-binding protein [Thermoplasmata archaeon]|nr:ATP/GTP-binding protein [Thermoplasmata archaeon]
MEEPGTIYFTGTAGAGKTSLVQAFQGWLDTQSIDVVTVNLDPGSEAGSFEPDVDIRDWVRLPQVMQEYGLGPNGAQVAAADMIALKIFEVKQSLDGYRAQYILVDTPGQFELFAFRESSKAIVDALSGDRSLIAFLFDPALARKASGFVSLRMLSATVEFRFRLPMLNLLTKSDVLTPGQLEEILSWGDNPMTLYEAVGQELPTPDVQLSTELFRAMETMAPQTALVPTSATEQKGLNVLYEAVERIFSGGADEETTEPIDDSE